MDMMLPTENGRSRLREPQALSRAAVDQPGSISVMFKPASSRCPLACRYCYYREPLVPAVGPPPGEVPEWLERFLSELFERASGAICLGWQGGEPLLAGLSYFRRVVALEARLARPGTVIDNDIQTSGVLVDEEWAAFLGDFRFLAGISLDGPAPIHDAVRVDRAGRGTHARAMAGLDRLRRRGVETCALCTIDTHNVGHAEEVIDFFRGEGITAVQIMPAMGMLGNSPGSPAAPLAGAEALGACLSTWFDAWFQDGWPVLRVSLFDALLAARLGRPGALCLIAPTCDGGLVVEADGGVYPCDFHIDPAHRLGTAGTTPLATLLDGPARRAFAGRKLPLPGACAACSFLSLCHGGCPRFRPDPTEPDSLCAAIRQLLVHAEARLNELAQRLERREARGRLISSGAEPEERNQPCLCGSGRKHKRCCGDPGAARSYLVRPGPRRQGSR